MAVNFTLKKTNFFYNNAEMLFKVCRFTKTINVFSSPRTKFQIYVIYK